MKEIVDKASSVIRGKHAITNDKDTFVVHIIVRDIM